MVVVVVVVIITSMMVVMMNSSSVRHLSGMIASLQTLLAHFCLSCTHRNDLVFGGGSFCHMTDTGHTPADAMKQPHPLTHSYASPHPFH